MPRKSRSMMSATLSLGLVAIPVGIHSTRRREGKVSYHLIHETCGSRVKRQYVCEQEDVPVPDDELTRAYEGDDGEVVISKDEAKQIAPQATGRIDLIEFVPTESIDPVYFDAAYYLAPGKGGDRAYHLLAATLRAQAMVGVGTQLARGKSYLVAVRATELGMVMHTLHHAEEVHPEKEVEHGEPGRTNASEKELAETLVHKLHKATFDPSKFEDAADEAMRKAIKARSPRKADDDKAEAAPPGKVADLLETLRASIAGKVAGKRPARAKRAAAKPRSRKPARKKAS